MSDLTSGLVGFLASTAAIVLLGEILPQALCSRYALQTGAKAVPLVSQSRRCVSVGWLGGWVIWLVDGCDATAEGGLDGWMDGWME